MTREPDPLRDAARDAARRAERLKKDPPLSLGRRLGQIGVLGWMTVIPTLLGVLVGSVVDGWLGSGITITAALTMLGAGCGLWLAFRWMKDQ